MINETTLTISFILLMLFIFGSLIYLFYVIMDRLITNKLTAFLYAVLQTSASVILAGIVYRLLSPLLNPAELHIHHLLNYSFYPVIGWNIFFGIVFLLILINGALHHLISNRKAKVRYRG